MPSVIANGIRMHYEERGSGEPLLLLMGLGADGPTWAEHVRHYERRFRCLFPDNRGAGRSDHPPGPYSTGMMAEDAASLMDRLGIPSAHVSGISMGSAIAQELALRYPQRVRSLSLHCPWSKLDNYGMRVFETLRSARATSDGRTFARLLQLIIFSPAYHEQHPDELLKREADGLNYPYPMPLHAFQAQCDACMTHHTQGKLGEIRCPVLITVGDRDIFTPPGYARDIADEIAGAELVQFAGCGHTHHWEQVDRFNRLSLDFLVRHSAS